MSGFQDKANFIWSVADEILRDDFKRSRYADVILPFTVLRRIDCTLAPTKDRVLQKNEELKSRGLERVDESLRRVSGYFYFNISNYTFEKLLEDPKNVGPNLRTYINGFGEEMGEVLERFKLRTTIDALEEKGLLYQVIQKFDGVDLHPHTVPNHEMGTIFEELLRRFNEQTNENPGEHFTPREVVQLMVRLLMEKDERTISQQGIIRTVYDPACGTGGMLSTAEDYARDINPFAKIHLYGQEVNDETYAVCKSGLLIKGDDEDAQNIKPGSSFSQDGHAHRKFDYMICNPPYGKDWKKEKTYIDEETERGFAGRFGAGLPRTSDGQLLFLQHMISKRQSEQEGGSRIAIVLNGSPLFTGGAGSGESEIRRWILENDLLEAIVSLPGQLFYNTGISTYIWILSTRKEEDRKGKVLLVNGAAREKTGGKEVEVFAQDMKKSLGEKRKELSGEHMDRLSGLSRSLEDGEHTRVFANEDFGYRRITVERPLRLNFQASSERAERLKDEKAFQNLASSKKKGDAAEEDKRAGREQQLKILTALSDMDTEEPYTSRETFEDDLDNSFREAGVKVRAPLKKAIISALSERDPEAEVRTDGKGNVEPDTELRDFENVALGKDVYEYFEREVKPHLHDAWINESVRDEKDGGIGRVGYEINFNRYFYRYEPPRPLEEIDADIKTVEREILELLGEVTS